MKTKTSHTPGPWKTREWPKPNSEGPFLAISISHESPTSSGPEIAVVHAAHVTAEADEATRANARLIAATPDLLNAVQEVYNNMPRTTENNWMLGVLRNALIKAGG